MRLKRFVPAVVCMATLLCNSNLSDVYAASIENSDSTEIEINVEVGEDDSLSTHDTNDEEEALTDFETNNDEKTSTTSEELLEISTDTEELVAFPDEEIINADMADDEINDDSLNGSWYDKYIKDSDGRLIRKEIYTISGVLSYIEEYEYDSNGNKIKMTRRVYVTSGDDKGKLNYLYEYEYNTNGKKKKLIYTEYVFC